MESGEHTFIETFGLDASDGLAESIDASNAENCIFWMGDGAYFSPAFPEVFFVSGDEYNLWNRSETWEMLTPVKAIWDENPELIDQVGKTFYMFGGGPVLGYAKSYTYRTPDFFLSSVQDYNSKCSARVTPLLTL